MNVASLYRRDKSCAKTMLNEKKQMQKGIHLCETRKLKPRKLYNVHKYINIHNKSTEIHMGINNEYMIMITISGEVEGGNYKCIAQFFLKM